MKPTIFIKKGCPVIIKVEDLPDERYFDYNEREAIKLYRQKYNLVGLHLQKVYTTPSTFGYLN